MNASLSKVKENLIGKGLPRGLASSTGLEPVSKA